MSHTPKSKYVGDHGGAYTDIDGMRKQFTVVDHDKKIQISSSLDERLPENWQAEYRASLVKRIAEVPASLCHEWFYDFTLRGEGQTEITWNMDMLLDSGVPISQLRDICVILENRVESRGKLF
jgi:hypothetical protein